MIKRIVKLTFRAAEIETFRSNFEAVKDKIRAFEGCQHLELWQDQQDERVFFTYSFWESEAHLEVYRHSELFKATWAKTKILFDDKPLAWSVKMMSHAE